MIVQCGKCLAEFDDEFRDTGCPHPTFSANDGHGNFRHYPESYLGPVNSPPTSRLGAHLARARGVLNYAMQSTETNSQRLNEIGAADGPKPALSVQAPFRLQDLTPVRDRLIVAPLAVSSRSKGGIHLVETGHQRERPQHGIVLATGAGNWNSAKTERVPVEASVGDCVFYGKYSGQAFDIGDREVLNMSEAEVFSILRQGAFVLVEHDNPKLNHLQGDFCDLCATPEELAAKARLEAERIALVESRVVQMDPEFMAGLDEQKTEQTAKDSLEAERERMRQLRENQG